MVIDDIDRELITLLCTKVGKLMEDHATIALTIGSRSADERITSIIALADASTELAKLAAATQSIAE